VLLKVLKLFKYWHSLWIFEFSGGWTHSVYFGDHPIFFLKLASSCYETLIILIYLLTKTEIDSTRLSFTARTYLLKCSRPHLLFTFQMDLIILFYFWPLIRATSRQWKILGSIGGVFAICKLKLRVILNCFVHILLQCWTDNISNHYLLIGLLVAIDASNNATHHALEGRRVLILLVRAQYLWRIIAD